MNADAVQMAARKLITALAGYLIGRGILSESDITPQTIDLVAGAIGIIITSVWSKKHYAKAKNKPATHTHIDDL